MENKKDCSWKKKEKQGSIAGGLDGRELQQPLAQCPGAVDRLGQQMPDLVGRQSRQIRYSRQSGQIGIGIGIGIGSRALAERGRGFGKMDWVERRAAPGGGAALEGRAEQPRRRYRGAGGRGAHRQTGCREADSRGELSDGLGDNRRAGGPGRKEGLGGRDADSREQRRKRQKRRGREAVEDSKKKIAAIRGDLELGGKESRNGSERLGQIGQTEDRSRKEISEQKDGIEQATDVGRCPDAGEVLGENKSGVEATRAVIGVDGVVAEDVEMGLGLAGTKELELAGGRKAIGEIEVGEEIKDAGGRGAEVAEAGGAREKAAGAKKLVKRSDRRGQGVFVERDQEETEAEIGSGKKRLGGGLEAEQDAGELGDLRGDVLDAAVAAGLAESGKNQIGVEENGRTRRGELQSGKIGEAGDVEKADARSEVVGWVSHGLERLVVEEVGGIDDQTGQRRSGSRDGRRIGIWPLVGDLLVGELLI